MRYNISGTPPPGKKNTVNGKDFRKYLEGAAQHWDHLTPDKQDKLAKHGKESKRKADQN
jgi:hypothetical protein